MTLDDRVGLIRPGVDRRDGTWADLGAGTGAFTFALAALLGPDAVIHALDRNPGALRALEREASELRDRAGEGRAPRIICTPADFTREVFLPPLDGALMANALHFHADACGILRRITRRLKPGGVLILVEYDITRPNPWVPHPLPWSRFPEAAACAGLSGARLLGTRPSDYHRSMYAAACSAAGASPS
jgi:SAM-dependent methyltransferase